MALHASLSADSVKAEESFFKRYKAVILFVAAILVALIVGALPITSLSRDAHITLAVFTFVVVLWIGEVLPVGISAVLFCMALVVILGKRMPASVVFGGFSSATIWLLIGAFLLGEATVATGLAHRIAYLTMRLGRSSHRRVIIYLWLTQTILGLLTPSTTVRAAMFIPIMLGIAQAYKAKPDSKFAANLLLHCYWGMQLASLLWYTGTIINPQMMGILKSVTGYGPSYFVYVVWNIVPCIIFAVGTFFIIEWVMPAEKEITNTGTIDHLDKKLAEMGPMSADEWKSLIFFLVAITLWATEKLHHIDTAWVALGLASLLFLPKLGVLKAKALNNLNWDIVLLMAVAIGVIDIMKVVKLDIWVTNQLLAPILNPLARYGTAALAFGITIVTALVHFIASSAVGETALMGPLVIRFAHLMGYDPIIAAIVTSKAEMNVFIFPYQMTPLLVLWGTGFMDMKKCLRCFGVTCIFNIVWIVAMTPVWEWTVRIIK